MCDNLCHLTPEEIEQKIAEGDLERCAACDEVSAYDYTLADMQPGETADSDTITRFGWDPGQIAIVGGASGFEWQCGHCGATNVPHNSPLLAECYTHYPPEELGYDPDEHEDEEKASRNGHV